MNLHQLECFVTAASCHSFSLAARKLYLSQPNLSKSIDQLENELGVSLFHRSNKGVTLTNDGIDLLNQAMTILNHVHSINEYYELRKKQIYELKISSQPIYSVIKTLSQMQNAETLIRYHETNRNQVINNVINNHSEVGIIMTSSIDPLRFQDVFLENHLQFQIIKEAKAKVYLHKYHPLSKSLKISQKDLNQYPQIIFNLDNYTENVLINYDQHSAVTNSLIFAKESLKHNHTYIIQTPWDKELFEDSDILSFDLEDQSVRVQIGYCYYKDRQLSQSVIQFLDEFQKYIF